MSGLAAKDEEGQNVRIIIMYEIMFYRYKNVLSGVVAKNDEGQNVRIVIM